MNSRVPTITTHGTRFPWWIPLIVGIVVVVAGVGLVVWPFVAATWLLVLLFGSALIANGLAMLVSLRFSAGSTVGGIVLILGGMLAIVFSEFTVTALVTFVGVALVIAGVFWLVVAGRVAASTSFFVLLPAVLTILVGIVTLVWPGFAITVVAVLSGLFTIALGVSMIWTATRLRSVRVSETTIVIE